MAASSDISSIFDSYIGREPAGDVPLLIRNGPDEYTSLLRTLQRSADHFSERDQTRVLEKVRFEQARLHMQNQQWRHAMRILLPLWQSLGWRRSGWWLLLEEVDLALQECARHVEDADTLVAVQWELLNKSLTPTQDLHVDFRNVLQDLTPVRERPRVKLRAENVVSCVSVGFAFATPEGNVGSPLKSQLVLTSQAKAFSNPITVTKVRISFAGDLRAIELQHDASASDVQSDAGPQVQDIVLRKHPVEAQNVPASPASPMGVASLKGSSDLTLTPGSSKAFWFTDVPRYAGEDEVSSITLVIEEEGFDLELLITEPEQMQQDHILVQDNAKSALRHVSGRFSSSIRVLPKPPKVRLDLSTNDEHHFTDEISTLIIGVVNDEDDEVNINLNARILWSTDNTPSIAWAQDEDGNEPLEEEIPSGIAEMHRDVGTLKRSENRDMKMIIKAPSQPVECTLEIRAHYQLMSDRETPVMKAATKTFEFRRPFEVVTTSSPETNYNGWPDYFEVNSDDDEETGSLRASNARGLKQQWSIISRITSLAASPIVLENIDIQVQNAPKDVKSAVSLVDLGAPKILPPAGLQQRQVNLDVQKMSLEDRRSTVLDLNLVITWRREGSSTPLTITYRPVPNLIIPFGEPRVLASARNGTSPSGVIHLTYMIENPSSYTLTFNLTMETSDEFAFSGMKNVTAQLVPTSRHLLKYNLLPLLKGAWINPQLKVYDTQFHKTLRIQGTEGMRNDKKGVGIWIDADG